MLAGFRSRWTIPFVRSLERLGNLSGDRQRVGDRRRPTFEAIGQRWPVDELKYQRCNAVGLLQPVDCTDMGMIQGGEQARFPRKSGPAHPDRR